MWDVVTIQGGGCPEGRTTNLKRVKTGMVSRPGASDHTARLMERDNEGKKETLNVPPEKPLKLKKW